MKLVIGASGFLGSHVVRQLVERGESVRVLLRHTSSTRAIDDLGVERRYGDIFDAAAVRDAMEGCDDVYYCVVDARAWLRDPADLFRTNVEGLRQVLDVAVDADLRRFVFTSTIGTIALSDEGLATEDEPFNWLDRGGAYIRSRVDAENLVLDYARDRGLPAVALCVSNTYGPGDWQPTPHGSLLAAAAAGKMPVYVKDMAMEVVGIEDAARALILAADHGRVGERYIVSERFISARELYEAAADAGGAKRPRFGIPLKAMYVLGFGGDVAATVLRRDMVLSRLSVRLMHIMSPMDHRKAERELGWHPEPIHDSIRKAVHFYRSRAAADGPASRAR
ncbi:NAD-dependent epimerase/dehydratase family protein [Mycolicibacter kumamotonensis]|uniref:NAD-dependent epimerase/dehydratase family protein n=1 Tax=Mycolicibacter kumamotonensis TaxID=354243 RepID=A0A7K3L621_9MYCO|nr:NAD-dependent epimerase/dehydratase family protein [Mycolicibacter kumamotonensis]NDJ87871.1 NAD-dependent epimerase/dehydratase family protein [Mycolicibacter kumamotonensis]